MDSFLMFLLACLLLFAAGYAQLRIPRYTTGALRVLLIRTILLVVGIASGYVAAATYANNSALALLPFLIGFGAVHFPAAVILFIKRERGAGKS